MSIGDIVCLVEYEPGQSKKCGVGIVLEILNGGYARKHASALVYWSKLNTTGFHPEPQLRIINE